MIVVQHHVQSLAQRVIGVPAAAVHHGVNRIIQRLVRRMGAGIDSEPTDAQGHHHGDDNQQDGQPSGKPHYLELSSTNLKPTPRTVLMGAKSPL